MMLYSFLHFEAFGHILHCCCVWRTSHWKASSAVQLPFCVQRRSQAAAWFFAFLLSWFWNQGLKCSPKLKKKTPTTSHPIQGKVLTSRKDMTALGRRRSGKGSSGSLTAWLTADKTHQLLETGATFKVSSINGMQTSPGSTDEKCRKKS